MVRRGGGIVLALEQLFAGGKKKENTRCARTQKRKKARGASQMLEFTTIGQEKEIHAYRMPWLVSADEE